MPDQIRRIRTPLPRLKMTSSMSNVTYSAAAATCLRPACDVSMCSWHHVNCRRQKLIIIMRPSSLGGGRILRRTLSVRLSVRPSRYISLPIVASRHLANYNDTHVLLGMHRGPHIVRPSRPHKLVIININLLIY